MAAITAFLFSAAFLPAVAQPTEQNASLHISGLAPVAKDSAWAWGIQSGRFVLLKTNNRGRHWTGCSLPPELNEFIQYQHVQVAAGDDSFLYEIPLSASFPDADNAWVTWLAKTANDGPANVVTVHSGDRCRSWTVASAPKPILGATSKVLDIKTPFSAGINGQFIGQNGWALLSGNPEAGSCPNSLIATHDAGRSWQWIPGEPQFSYFPSQGCPWPRLSFRSSTEGWLAQADYSGDNSRSLWRTTDGGKIWVNLSALIKTPDGLAEAGSNTLDMNPPAWASANSSTGTLSIVYNKTSPQETNVDEASDNPQEEFHDTAVQQTLAIYHTTDDGLSWQMVKVFPPSPDRQSDLTFQDDLHGLVVQRAVGENADENRAAGYLAYTADGGLSWSRHEMPEAIDQNSLILRYNTIWAVQNAKSQDPQTLLLMSTDGGATWQKRPIVTK